MRVECPKGHFIAEVDINAEGHVIPRGLRHGLSWDYAPSRDLTRIRGRCQRCGYDGSVDYAVLCAEVTQAAASGNVEYRMTM